MPSALASSRNQKVAGPSRTETPRQEAGAGQRHARPERRPWGREPHVLTA
jgi:hypothetical protein